MAGHNKWSKIKHKKAITDSKKGKIFTRLGRNVTLAARAGGGDADMNFQLRLAIDTAKAANMPLENVERAIKKGTGELKDESVIEEKSYEAYGPGGLPMIIDTATDNANRTISEIRKTVGDSGGSMGDSGSVARQFALRGLIILRTAKKSESAQHGKDFDITEFDSEEVTLELMDIDGVLDIVEAHVHDAEDESKTYPGLQVQTEKKSFAQIHKKLDEEGYMINTAEIIKIPSVTMDLDSATEAKVDALIENLEEIDDVQSVWDARAN